MRSTQVDETMKMARINLLGKNFFKAKNVSIILSPNQFKSALETKEIFYLAPFDMLDTAKVLGKSHKQQPNVFKQLEIRSFHSMPAKSGIKSGCHSDPPKKSDEKGNVKKGIKF